MVWPENWPALQVFSRMTTQLNVGAMGGVIGLRYEALPFVMQVCQINTADQAEAMDAVQVMERHLVQRLNEKK